ncbi:acyltransferase domain-containing protein [Geomobilimonas luticola]|uniref:[acyl-carrier-protein] S-malonyltransferase n=1 Tax=Geomobilimonas luticola TaxID=1114878 RepID=A0ABS5SAJ0_9BACT|nr:acyltransferase domain-containing protein [Geomobilimonas luticola]MBT0652386.1 ACP S-malonyltransferase [Geomobilimonas luticola]
MNCFMFPGQPLSHGTEWPDDPDFKAIADMTRRRAFFDLETFSWVGAVGTDNVKLQLFGTAMSLYRFRVLRRERPLPDFVAEHSMGIYPALAACGSLPEEAALEMTFRVGTCLARMGERCSYALGCVVGLPREPLLAIAENHGVYMANYNTSRHFLLSGERSAMEAAMAEALATGAFSARTFPCDTPLHTPLIGEIDGELRGIFNHYRYGEPRTRLMDHINQDYLGAADVAPFLREELQRPVFWEKSYRALRAAGVTSFVEVGMGDSLKKYNRWIDGELRS